MLRDWVQAAKEKGASDLLLEAGTPIVLRVRGELTSGGEPVSPELLMQTARELLAGQNWQDFLSRRSYDLSQTIAGTRCRINVYQTIRGIGLAVRILSSFQASLRDCNLHPSLLPFIEQRTGLLLISGPTGSGKSTTMAALLEEINARQARNIITIESPIEYFFRNKRSFVRQREVPLHTPSFEQAIVDSMRENPDLLVIGEMRTPDVMRLTLSAAETGHLVIATTHSSSCAEALARICMSFAPEIQGSIRAQLADCLVGVICQRLSYLPQYQVRVPVCEVLTATSGVKGSLRSGNLSQLNSAIQTGGEDGMWSFERYQRWIDQKRDWVKPAQAAPLSEDRVPASAVASELRTTRPATPQEAKGTVAPSVRPAGPARTPSAPRPAEATAPDPEGRIEIPVSDADLEDLAKKIGDPNE